MVPKITGVGTMLSKNNHIFEPKHSAPMLPWEIVSLGTGRASEMQSQHAQASVYRLIVGIAELRRTFFDWLKTERRVGQAPHAKFLRR
jgi:hypothetical protein